MNKDDSGFVGREWALARVDSWLGGSEQSFLITGGPGTGKSTLATQLATTSGGSESAAGTNLRANAVAASHFCRALDSSLIDPLRFVERVSQALARFHEPYASALLELGEQRIEVHGTSNVGTAAPGAEVAGVRIDTVRVGDMSAALAFERVIRGPLSSVAPPARPLVVLVDALDEALTLRADETLVDVIADTLAAGTVPPAVRFLLTSRPDPRVLERFPLPPTTRFDLFEDSPVEPPRAEQASKPLDDVGRYARSRLDAVGAPHAERAARRIAAAASGNFLYARYVLDQAIASDDLDLTSTALPAGLDALYREYLERELARKREAWEDRYRPLLGALAVARGAGLTRAWLEGAAGLPESQVDDALLRLGQYLASPASEGPFRIYHQSFRDFLLSDAKYRVYASEANAAVASFAIDEYGTDWLDCSDAYAIEHVVAHLADAIRTSRESQSRARRLEQLGRLVADLAYIAARAHWSGSASAEGDIAAANELSPNELRQSSLRRQLAQISPLVDRCTSAHDAAITLLTRLAHVPGLEGLIDDLVDRLPPPYITARYALPDLPHPAMVRALALPSAPEACAISIHGTLVAWLPDGELQVWDTVTGTQLRRAEIGKPDGGALGADASAAVFVFDEDGRVELWDCASGTLRKTFGPVADSVAACAVSADGGIIAVAGKQGTVELWDAINEERIDAFPATTPIVGCAVSRDGSVVVSHVGTRDNLPGLGGGEWEDYVFPDGPLELHFRGQGSVPSGLVGRPASAFALSADGTTLVVAQEEADDDDETSDDSGAPRFAAFDLKTGACVVLAPSDDEEGSCAVSANGEVVALADPYDELALWAADTGKLTILEASHPTSVALMGMSPGGEFVVSAIEEQISVWDAQKRVGRARPEGRNTWALSPFAAGRRMLCAVRDEGAEIWDTEAGAPLEFLVKMTTPLEQCAASEDGHAAVTAQWSIGLEEGAEVNVWSLEAHHNLHEVPSARRPVAMSRDGRLLIVDRENEGPGVWNIEQAQYEPDCLPGAKPGSAYALSPDGTTAAIGHRDGSLELWADLRQCSRYGGPEHDERGDEEQELQILDLKFRADGQSLISSSADGTVTVRDEGGHPHHALRGHDTWVRGCDLSPDGRHAVSVDTKGCLKVWKLENGECLITQHVHGVLFDCRWLGDADIALAGTRGVYFLRLLEG